MSRCPCDPISELKEITAFTGNINASQALIVLQTTSLRAEYLRVVMVMVIYGKTKTDGM